MSDPVNNQPPQSTPPRVPPARHDELTQREVESLRAIEMDPEEFTALWLLPYGPPGLFQGNTGDDLFQQAFMLPRGTMKLQTRSRLVVPGSSSEEKLGQGIMGCACRLIVRKDALCATTGDETDPEESP